MGGSAGGLLMGAIINMKPALWAGVVAAVPFVDVVTTMLDDSIPLTTGEYDENETLIFITTVEHNLPGAYGVYDYELRVPSALSRSVGGSDTLDLYIELE